MTKLVLTLSAKYGHIDDSGKMVVPAKYDNVANFRIALQK